MDNIREQLQENFDEPLLFADGFDNCIIGVCEDFGTTRVVYCIGKMLETLFNDAGIPYDEALEYLEYNTLNAWVGESTPIYVEPKNVL